MQCSTVQYSTVQYILGGVRGKIALCPAVKPSSKLSKQTTTTTSIISTELSKSKFMSSEGKTSPWGGVLPLPKLVDCISNSGRRSSTWQDQSVAIREWPDNATPICVPAQTVSRGVTQDIFTVEESGGEGVEVGDRAEVEEDIVSVEGFGEVIQDIVGVAGNVSSGEGIGGNIEDIEAATGEAAEGVESEEEVSGEDVYGEVSGDGAEYFEAVPKEGGDFKAVPREVANTKDNSDEYISGYKVEEVRRSDSSPSRGVVYQGRLSPCFQGRLSPCFQGRLSGDFLGQLGEQGTSTENKTLSNNRACSVTGEDFQGRFGDERGSLTENKTLANNRACCGAGDFVERLGEQGSIENKTLSNNRACGDGRFLDRDDQFLFENNQSKFAGKLRAGDRDKDTREKAEPSTEAAEASFGVVDLSAGEGKHETEEEESVQLRPGRVRVLSVKSSESIVDFKAEPEEAEPIEDQEGIGTGHLPRLMRADPVAMSSPSFFDRVKLANKEETICLNRIESNQVK